MGQGALGDAVAIVVVCVAAGCAVVDEVQAGCAGWVAGYCDTAYVGIPRWNIVNTLRIFIEDVTRVTS